MKWLGVTLLGFVLIAAGYYLSTSHRSADVRVLLETLEVDGVERQFRLVIPDQCLKPAPLLIALHGSGDTAEGMATYSQLDHLADQHQFLLVYPEAIRSRWKLDPQESAPNADIKFLDRVIAELSSQHSIDRERVYLVGMSDGGMFAQIYANDRETIAAMAIHSSTRPRSLPWPDVTRKTPILLIVGTADRVESRVKKTASDYQERGYTTEFVSVEGLGHAWSRAHNARIWSFLQQQRLK